MKRYFILVVSFVLLCGGGYFVFQFAKIEIKARVAQVLLQHTWHKTLMTGQYQRPWKSFDGAPILRLVIPNFDIDQIVLAGTSGQALAFGPAFHQESVLPGLGGTIILSSHRDSHGLYIKHLQKNNIIELQDRSQKWHSFRVEDFSIVDVTTNNTLPFNHEETLLLITCYPFDALTSDTPLRYIVKATRVEHKT